MNTQRLREAARVLRDQSEAVASVVEITYGGNSTTAYVNATGDYFLDRQGDEYGSRRVLADWPDIAQTGQWYELMRPDVAVALADWLDAEADERRWGRLRDFDAVGISDRIADLILGGTS